MSTKSKVLWVRVTPRINQYIRELAKQNETEIAEVIRRAILEYALSHPLKEENQNV